MPPLTLGSVGVTLGLWLRKLHSKFKPDSPWENADTSYPDNPAPVRSKAAAWEQVANQAAPSLASTPKLADGEELKGTWEDRDYCWVVVCKSHAFHRRRNVYNVHRIPLGRTDAVSDPPAIGHRFVVRSDECRKEFSYKPSEVLRWEMDLPLSFVPHPLFED